MSAKSLDVTKVSCGMSRKSGTSMATPVISGVTALVRQYFVQGYYPDGEKNPSRGFTPMGALLKAVLVNSAQRMTGPEATRQVLSSIARLLLLIKQRSGVYFF